MKKNALQPIVLFLFFSLTLTAQNRPQFNTTPATGAQMVKFTVELVKVSCSKSSDGSSNGDYEEEIYGAISVCLAATGYPPTVQRDYTARNPVNLEISGGVPPNPQSTNTNGRVLWRQSDSKNDRRIHLENHRFSSAGNRKTEFWINSKAVFIFDRNKDPQAAFRLFADMWESDSFDDDEHFNAGKRRISMAISEVVPGSPKTVRLEIFDSSSRHYAEIKITAENL